MTEKAKAAQRAYLAAWRRKNPGKVQEYNRRYWEKRAEKQMENEKSGDGGETNAETQRF